MFNFFRRKKKIHLKGWENDLFLNIFKELGDEYLYYERQIREGIFESIQPNNKTMPNCVNLGLNVKLLNKYEKKKEAFRTVSGVKVFDEKTLEFKDIEIDLGYGLVLGYCTEDILNFNPDVTKIKIGIIKKRYPDNNDFDEISFLFSKKEKELLNISDVYKVELEGKTYYHLKDLEDGDFIGIDIEKNIYVITHDPFKIILQKDTLEYFF